MSGVFLGGVGHDAEGVSAAVFVVHLSAGELEAVQELKERGGAFRFTVTSLQAVLDAEPMMVEIERVAQSFVHLLDQPVVTQ